MMLLVKKVGGLALALVGGLTAVHGVAVGQVWEILVGLLIVVIGILILVMKVVSRNTGYIGGRNK